MAPPKSAVNGERRSAPPTEALAPFLAHPRSAALIFDIDGTLAPIVQEPRNAAVPEPTRALLRALEHRFGLVACVSGRQALEARRIVGIDSITYAGNHGLELLEPGAERPATDPALPELAAQVRAFATAMHAERLAGLGIGVEDKDAIWALHWRGVPDEKGARDALEQVAAEAERRGLAPHWGRKVLEIRPRVAASKGTAVEAAVAGRAIERALYAGDDTTDLDAFRKLRELEAAGRLEALCIGVRSAEGPPEIVTEADLVVEGPEGLTELLGELAA